MCSRSRAKSRDDIMALMHVTDTGVEGRALNCELWESNEGSQLNALL